MRRRLSSMWWRWEGYARFPTRWPAIRPGARADESELRVRPLIVDGKIKEWTTGESHDVIDRSFAIRRALRLNDALPSDKPSEHMAHWVWQRGPWLLIDRAGGKVTALHLADFDPGVSDVVWFPDYAAYCGLNSTRKQLYAVVAQVAARKPLLARKLGAWDVENHPTPACELAAWQRTPLRIAFQLSGGQPVVFDLVGSSAVLWKMGMRRMGMVRPCDAALLPRLKCETWGTQLLQLRRGVL